MPRTRRPLLALLILLAALLIGYGVRAVRSNDSTAPSPAPSSAVSSSGAWTGGGAGL